MASVDGTYEVQVHALGKSTGATVVLQSEGSTVTGSIQVLGKDLVLENGRVEGNKLSGNAEGTTRLGKLRGKITGAVTGDEVAGKIKAGILGARFSGRRVS